MGCASKNKFVISSNESMVLKIKADIEKIELIMKLVILYQSFYHVE